MGGGLIVERRPRGTQITLPEWTKVVALDSDLRMRVEPYEMTDPRTGDTIRMKAGEADAELRVGDLWLPLLNYRRGRLTTRYVLDFDDAQNPVRLKIAAVAKQLQAVITTDVGDDLLNW